MSTKTTTLTTLATANRKINKLLSLEKITLADIEHLNRREREHLGQAATEILAELSGPERDDFLAKIEQITPASSKQDIWENNHQAISNAIADFMREYGVMPTKNAIAEETGLSRQTVAKHFKDYKSSPEFAEQIEQFKFMEPKILATVFKSASNGDMRAAKLYFETVGTVNKQPANTVVNGQTDYIQINNTILSQENLKQLSPEQLTLIENIVANKEYKMLSLEVNLQGRFGDFE